MIYTVEGNGKIFQIGVLKLKEFEESAAQLDINAREVEACVNNVTIFRNTIEVYEGYTFGMLSVIDVLNLSKIRKQIGFFLNDTKVVLIVLDKEDVETANQLVKTVLEKVGKTPTLEKLVCGIMERFLYSATEELTFTENVLVALEQQIAKEQILEDADKELFELRNRASTLKMFYDQMIDVGEALQEDSAHLFNCEEAQMFKNFTSKAERFKERSQMLSDNLIYLWELLDAKMNNRLNNTMKVLTIVTIIFQPLTMIAGWYGMNFVGMPELTWQYGYLYVIILNALIILGTWIFFKKKKLL